jgi:hypothetical protein
MAILKDAKTGETFKVQKCKYYGHEPALVYPWDNMAQRIDDGSLKCRPCCIRDLEDRIIRVTPKSERACEILEENRLVQRWNKHAARLNRKFGKEAPPTRKTGLLAS